jgi:prepilin-type N-terminal cleavage/methylation domain-containing protein
MARRRDQSGFSLVELSIVVVVIALIVGAVTIGGSLQRNAAYQKLGSGFVRGWQLAYLSYREKMGVVLLDSQLAPTGYIDGDTTGVDADGLVCAGELRQAMLSAGVTMPQGRSEGKNHLYAYLDSNGNPQQAEICFRANLWVEESGTTGSYENAVRNVMVVKGVTPDLARMIDAMVDVSRDAQFGTVRQYPVDPDSGAPVSREYSLDNTCVFGGGCGTGLDEAQVATMKIYFGLD